MAVEKKWNEVCRDKNKLLLVKQSAKTKRNFSELMVKKCVALNCTMDFALSANFMGYVKFALNILWCEIRTNQFYGVCPRL